MSDEFKFWTHGVSVQVEDDTGLTIRRAGWGAQIVAATNVTKWFHFPIPSATRLDDDDVDIQHAWLLGWISADAKIREVQVHMSSEEFSDNGPKMESKSIYRSVQDPKYGQLVKVGAETSGSVFTLGFDIKDERCKGPICMSVEVEFSGNFREIRFTGAGARFEEHT